MTDLDRLTELDEALDSWGPFDPAYPVDDGLKQKQRMLIADFAQAYRDLLANPAEPDWEAAASTLWNSSFGEPWESDLFSIAKGKARQEAKAIVEAAVGGRLLVEKP